MTFLERLDMLMGSKSLNKMQLSKLSGVPYTTIDGFYKKGYENAKISTIRKIATALNVSVDYLIEDTPTEKTPPSSKEAALLGSFHQLNDEGQEKLVDTADDMVRSGKYDKKTDPAELGQEA